MKFYLDDNGMEEKAPLDARSTVAITAALFVVNCFSTLVKVGAAQFF